ncbi:MAG TPA: sigma-70 family RNA polymerase sigma factor [Candidatus Limnocylindrales bacterium]|nr:sigma-70 family RNA polymerase sigma factor [Candidatus Limnocylindrales bacterium]
MVSVPAAGVDEPRDGLVERAIRGDEAAFARIVRLHHEDMTRVAFVVSGDTSIAEEAVASAWPIAWRRLRSLRDPDRLRAWLCSVAANEARQLIRSRRRRSVVEIPVDAAVGGAGTDPATRAADLDLANALARLAPEDRALLALRYVAGLTSTELGQALGMSASGTRARLARLLGRLREELGDG